MPQQHPATPAKPREARRGGKGGLTGARLPIGAPRRARTAPQHGGRAARGAPGAYPPSARHARAPASRLAQRQRERAGRREGHSLPERFAQRAAHAPAATASALVASRDRRPLARTLHMCKREACGAGASHARSSCYASARSGCPALLASVTPLCGRARCSPHDFCLDIVVTSIDTQYWVSCLRDGLRIGMVVSAALFVARGAGDYSTRAGATVGATSGRTRRCRQQINAPCGGLHTYA